MSDAPRNLALILDEAAAYHPGKKTFLRKESGRYDGMTWADALGAARALGAALAKRGVKRGDRVILLSENRPEWAIADFALLSIGAAAVPVYPTLSAAEIRYLVSDSGAAYAFVSSTGLAEKLAAALSGGPKLCGVAVFDAPSKAAAWPAGLAVETYRELVKEPFDRKKQDALAASIEPSELATVIYTSGTTGVPKGVMLTHANFLANAALSRRAFKMSSSEVHLSFLPLSHVFERLCGHYLMAHLGATIAYAESLETVPANLLEVRPTFILGVPRFFEKIRDRVLAAVAAGGPLRSGLFAWARECGRRRRMAIEAGRDPDFRTRLSCAAADILAYRRFRKRMGGRVRFCVSGGAALPREIGEFFCDMGVMIYEGYGLTETSPVISANREGRWRFGTVGVPFEGIDVKIGDDGEILTRGACVMRGYWNKPEETAAALEGGWFHTGDLGKIDREGFLHITGRKKELLVTSGGKKVSVRSVEELMEADEFILRCVLFGEGKKFVTALLVPRREKLVEWARSQKLAAESFEEILKDPAVKRFIEARIAERSKDLASYERIKYFVLADRDFTQEAGELTPTLKVKRDVVLSRHRESLLKLYENEAV